MKQNGIYKLNRDKKMHFNDAFEDDFIRLHFAGNLRCTSYFELKPHTNPGYEICIIKDGKGFFKVKDDVYSVTDGQIFITKPLEPHSGWPSTDDPYSILYICFSIKEQAFNNSLWGEIVEGLSNIAFHVKSDCFELHEIHKRLIKEIMGQYEFSETVISLLLRQYILITLRDFRKYGKNNDEEEVGINTEKSLSTRIIRYVDEYVETEQNLSLKTISGSFKYSVQNICRSFKKQTGFTVMEYYRISRMEKSKKYLVETDINISQISERLCFNSIHHFSNAFKAIYSCSPAQYRKLNNAKKM